MTGSDEIDELVRRMHAGLLPIADVRRLIRSKSPLVRANALNYLVADARRDPLSLSSIDAAVTETQNGFRLRGLITVSFVAMECLLRVGTPAATSAFFAHLAKWPEPDRTELIRFIESQGLTV